MVHGIREYWRDRPGQELGTIMEHYAMYRSEPHYQSRCRETTLLCFKKHDSDGDGLLQSSEFVAFYNEATGSTNGSDYIYRSMDAYDKAYSGVTLDDYLECMLSWHQDALDV